MEFKEIIGQVRKFGDNINTDLIIPSQYLTVNDHGILIAHAFEGVKKDFSKSVKKGDIIIARKNFGSGSSREEAGFVVKELGIAVVVAQSFSRIYFRNLVNLGIPAITIPNLPDDIAENDEVMINLSEGLFKIIKSKNKKIENTQIRFQPLPQFIMNIIEDGGALMHLKKNLKDRKK